MGTIINRPTLQVFNIVLSVNFTHIQIIAFQDDLRQELCASVIFKHSRHEVVVDQTKLTNPL